jgi:predicted Zn-dependent protease
MNAATTRADRLDLSALAERLRDLAERARRLPPPSHRDPNAFHEARDDLGADIETVARQLAGRPTSRGQ